MRAACGSLRELSIGSIVQAGTIACWTGGASSGYLSRSSPPARSGNATAVEREKSGAQQDTVRAAQSPPAKLHFCAANTACVLVSKSEASCRSCNCSDKSPTTRFTIRPRRTAGRSPIAFAQR